MKCGKYKKYDKMQIVNRKWPDNEIFKAPIWCSVDLRDGNQSLPTPMSVNEKVRMFKMLIDTGFKEIEVGFPSASNTEYTFLRKLIDENMIPDDVTIQVLTQSRAHLIEKTFESIRGCKKAIIHLYNSTSVLQRDVVFNMSKQEIIDIAVEGAKLFNEEVKKYPETEFTFEYSPESFTGTEMDYALEICEAVIDVWKPTLQKKVIINLPSTVEMATPNVYADQIEWFCENVSCRDSIILSLHTHNDRGTCTAASELGLLAGADRLEGTLFGNGERTGNMDIVNVGLNLYTQGINPELDFSNIDKIREIYEDCTKLVVHDRHPYAGNLVHCAFSGSHQDAIRKGMIAMKNRDNDYWEVPYLPIDPHDIGREYKEIIRINSQSGKGGAVYIMETDYGFMIPKNMHSDFGNVVKMESDRIGEELSSEAIFNLFKKEYIEVESPYKVKKYKIKSMDELNYENDDSNDTNMIEMTARISYMGNEQRIVGIGNGPVDSFNNALKQCGMKDYKFRYYWEHALEEGSHSRGVAYVGIEHNNEVYFGVSISENINTAAINALMNAINKSYIEEEIKNGDDYDAENISQTC